ncbi:MAG: ACT domain-containing protein [Planctomycetes bacterium]|nr:ACT domain-containing protein [Planctomycetota bacterium]MBU1518258.1 ACT domain-containing protein [Planctomycetota bacterium]MBU2596432.1 ACT domain-containing protein [Planctomycetota bacterium]
MAAKKQSQICIITVMGKDKVGIIAKLANAMARANINIVDVNQKIMENFFVMTMAVNIAKATISIPQIHRRLDKIGEEIKLKITFQDEKIFKMTHRV